MTHGAKGHHGQHGSAKGGYTIEVCGQGVRGKCAGKCKKPMQQGELRVGTVTEAVNSSTGNAQTRVSWRHFPECTTPLIASHVLECYGGSAEKVPGMEDLNEASRESAVAKLQEMAAQKGDKKAKGEGTPSPKKAKVVAKKGGKKKKEEHEEEEAAEEEGEEEHEEGGDEVGVHVGEKRARAVKA